MRPHYLFPTSWLVCGWGRWRTVADGLSAPGGRRIASLRVWRCSAASSHCWVSSCWVRYCWVRSCRVWPALTRPVALSARPRRTSARRLPRYATGGTGGSRGLLEPLLMSLPVLPLDAIRVPASLAPAPRPARSLFCPARASATGQHRVVVISRSVHRPACRLTVPPRSLRSLTQDAHVDSRPPPADADYRVLIDRTSTWCRRVAASRRSGSPTTSITTFSDLVEHHHVSVELIPRT